MNNNQPLIKTYALTKAFGDKIVLNDINLDIHRGRIVGLLGLNGAGKTTFLKHLFGLHLATSGEVIVFGKDHRELGPEELSRIGYVDQEHELIGWMSVSQIIDYVSSYYPNWNKDLQYELTEKFDVPKTGRIATLSTGERQKLAILLAVCHEPELLILDEPASALDPIARAKFLDLLLQLIQDQKKTIIISSHILSDVEKVVDHAVIFRDGKLAFDNSFDALREKYLCLELQSPRGGLPNELEIPGAFNLNIVGQGAECIVPQELLESAESLLRERSLSFSSRPLRLEEAFTVVVQDEQGVGK